MPPALYYFQSSSAPAPNRPARFGSAVIVMYNGQVLLEEKIPVTGESSVVTSTVKKPFLPVQFEEQRKRQELS